MVDQTFESRPVPSAPGAGGGGAGGGAGADGGADGLAALGVEADTAGLAAIGAEAVALVRRWLDGSVPAAASGSDAPDAAGSGVSTAAASSAPPAASTAPASSAPRAASTEPDAATEHARLTFAAAFIDAVVRPDDSAVAARNLERLAADAPELLPARLRSAIRIGGTVGEALPWAVVPTARRVLRRMLAPLVLDATPSKLADSIASLTADGSRLTLEPLGDPVLGEVGAARRLDAIRALVARRDVDSVALPLPTLAPNLSLWEFDESVKWLAAALLPLYELALPAAGGAAAAEPADAADAAEAAVVTPADASVASPAGSTADASAARTGVAPDASVAASGAGDDARGVNAAPDASRGTLLTLDPGEYRYFELAIAVFQRLFSRPGLAHLEAGITLQADLPDALSALRRLQTWASARVAAGGAPLTVRLVRSGNRVEERLDAARHGWPLAIYSDPRDVDRNLARLLEEALTPVRSDAARVVLASDNPFDIAFARVLAERRGLVGGAVAGAFSGDGGGGGASARLTFEVPPGSDPRLVEAVRRHVGGVRLRRPVVHPRELATASPYLLRMLDQKANDLHELPPGSAPDVSHAGSAPMADSHEAASSDAARPDAFETRRIRFLASLDGLTSSWPEREAFAVMDSILDSDETVLDARPPRPNRSQDRTLVTELVPSGASGFSNAPATDPSVPANREWARRILDRAAHSRLGLDTLSAARQRDALLAEAAAADAADAATAEAAASTPDDAATVDPSTTHDPATITGPAPADDHGTTDTQAAVDVPPTVDAPPAVGAADAASRAGLGALVGATAEAGGRWGTQPAAERAAQLRRAALALDANRDRLIEVMVSESGAAFEGADAEASTAVDFAAYHAGLALDLERIDGARHVPPVLVVVVPSPDAPVASPASGVLRALAAGAAVLLLPPPEARRASAVLVEALWESGIPRDALVLVDPAEARESSLRALVTDPRVDHVILNGAFEKAERLRSWRADLPLIADTGGRASVVVTPSADLDLAASDIARSEPAPTLLIVVGSVEKSPRFAAQLADALAASGRQPAPHHPETLHAPTLDDAIALQNATDGGAGAALHSLDPAEVEHWLAKVEAGDLFVNRAMTAGVVGRQPAGGWKRSSVGPGAKAGGPNALLHLGRWEPDETAENPEMEGPGLGLAGLDPKVQQLIESATAGLDWRQFDFVRRGALSDEAAHRTVFAAGATLRYRPVPVVIRLSENEPFEHLVRVLAAGTRARTSLGLSTALKLPRPLRALLKERRVRVFVENDAAWLERAAKVGAGSSRIRMIGGYPHALAEAVGGSPDVAIHAGAVTRAGRLEALPFLVEQTLSVEDQRFGAPGPLKDLQIG